MKRSLVFATLLAGTTAVFSACGGGTTNTAPNKPETKPTVAITPAPSVTVPVASPSVDPKASPAKPGTTPEVRKDDKKPVEPSKDAKPTSAATPKK